MINKNTLSKQRLPELKFELKTIVCIQASLNCVTVNLLVDNYLVKVFDVNKWRYQQDFYMNINYSVQSIRNAYRIRRKMRNGNVLMGTECFNIRFLGSLCYSAMCGIQRKAKKKKILITNLFLGREMTIVYSDVKCQ